jgi:uncharacterized OsmC-like protein
MDLIAVERTGGLEFKVSVRGHEVTCDMSEGDGGRDAGPSPAELLAGALGACIAMTIQGFCDRHGYTDGDVRVDLTLSLADQPKRVRDIVVDLELPPGVPQSELEVVRRLAERCLIHETLRNPPNVDVDIVWNATRPVPTR